MTQAERRIYLITTLLKEQPHYSEKHIPSDEQLQKKLLRALFNIRMPLPANDDFLTVQNAYLQEEIRIKGITGIDSMRPLQNDIYLWKGDIITLKCDAIVNAANSCMLGCFCPNHGCIDNAVHTFAGVQLRLYCAELMNRQGHEEETGKAKITPAFNLPSHYILHTIGPVIRGNLTKKDCDLLESCYRCCLESAEQNALNSIAFCCISTGEFCFPNNIAAEIAVQTVKKYKQQTQSKIKVIFNVFKENDYKIYNKLLRANK